MDSEPFKILSIDGGGIRGVIPCQILAELENDIIERDGPDARLCDYFDLIAGTSTGGIIAIGIALGIKTQTILKLYLNHGDEIFPSRNQRKISKAINIFHGNPFYERTRLKELLREAYEKNTGISDVRIGHARTRLLIPTYSLTNREIHVLKTSHSPKLQRDYQIPAIDAALSTAAAPAYFTPYDFQYNNIGKDGEGSMSKMVDGGIVANNPAFMALLEATNCLNIPLENIRLLSIGTGEEKKVCPKKSTEITPWFWVNPTNGPMLYEIMAEAQSAQVHNLLNLYKNGIGGGVDDRFLYVRLQHRFVDNDHIDLDSTSPENMKLMREVATRIYRHECANIKDNFTTLRKPEFIPHFKI